MKHETKVRILITMFKDLEQNVEDLKKEASVEYDDCAAEWYTNEIERTAKTIMDFLRTINKDKV